LDAPPLGGNPLSQSLNFFLELSHLPLRPSIKGTVFGAAQATKARRYLVPEASGPTLMAEKSSQVRY
jgi:hypothetical protein